MNRTNEAKEPSIKISACSYCGDAPINHTFSYAESAVTINLDNYGARVVNHVPNFVKNIVDFVPQFLFETLELLKLVKFSSDIERAHTFRSKVIWEEAARRGIKMEQ